MAGLTVEPLPPESRSGSSLLDEIRAEYRAAQQAPQHLDLRIPKSKLGVRYRALAPGDIPEADEDVQSHRNLDILVTACECIVVREDGRWVPWMPEGEPLRFTGELAELMGWPADTSRDVALMAFSTVPSPMYGVARHVTTYSQWVAGEDVAREEALLGES